MKTMQDQITLYFNADDPESRTLLGYAKSHGVPILAFDIRKRPLTPLQLLTFAARLNMEVEEMICEDKAKQLFSDWHDLSVEDWAEVLQKQPNLLKKPIAERKDNIKFLNSASEILQL